MAVANKHLEKAERLLQKGKHEAALEEYLLAWHEEPESDAIVYTIAELYQKLNRSTESHDCYVFLFDRAVERQDGPKVMELIRKMQMVGMLELEVVERERESMSRRAVRVVSSLTFLTFRQVVDTYTQ